MELDPEIAKRFWLAPYDKAPMNGESFMNVYERASEAFFYYCDYAWSNHIQDIVCFSHGGVIRALLALTLSLYPGSAFTFCVDNLSLSKIDVLKDQDQKMFFRITYVNK